MERLQSPAMDVGVSEVEQLEKTLVDLQRAFGNTDTQYDLPALQ